jgi:hypothetical protein
MAKRILPYRDYSEHDVVNLFALDTAGLTLADCKEAGSGDWDSGVVVKVKAGTLPGDVPSKLDSASGDKLRDYLGASFGSAHIGYNAYPSNGMTVEPAGAGDVAVGITLRETLAYDENGEKLLYYKQKLDETQAVLPGQTVPVLTRGLVLLDSNAVTGDPAVGAQLEVATDGTLVADTSAGNAMVATVLAKSGSDKFLCKISF